MDDERYEPCPNCGQLLTKALARAIADPEAPESCPNPPVKKHS